MPIIEGQYVAICMVVTGWTTPPRLSSTPTGAGAQLLIGEQPYSVYQGGQGLPAARVAGHDRGQVDPREPAVLVRLA
ncbi:hypothetical protein [Saccharopolyspora elongata]|uniref:Uncharacterized protein n=1 Tax=Saccharopolyspora elongata TaxID=2530387 RepID=A0A4V2YMJ9_9PSEU|nr:hypothetical protein [Saccharopolyspora elongata]TDD50767.1 hypothetical protein E1288_16365 [Saccharopolyspora elongata]